MPFEYLAEVKRIIDGDTIEFSVDLGFHIYFREQMRLAHYAAPEITGIERPLGLIAKQKLEEVLPVGALRTIRSHKTEKFGRWLVEIVLENGVSLSDYLIQEGYGLPYDDLPNEKKPSFDPQMPFPLTGHKGTAQ